VWSGTGGGSDSLVLDLGQSVAPVVRDERGRLDAAQGRLSASERRALPRAPREALGTRSPVGSLSCLDGVARSPLDRAHEPPVRERARARLRRFYADPPRRVAAAS